MCVVWKEAFKHFYTLFMAEWANNEKHSQVCITDESARYANATTSMCDSVVKSAFSTMVSILTGLST